MANYNFKTDLILGEEGESVVVGYLESRGATLITDNKDNRFDIKMTYKGVTKHYEIKTDVFCTPKRDTGNMFIEFECRGKASGVLVSQADWFVTYFPHLNEMWFITTQELKDILNTHYLPMTSQSGDKGSNTRGFLLPRNTYREHFKVIIC